MYGLMELAKLIDLTSIWRSDLDLKLKLDPIRAIRSNDSLYNRPTLLKLPYHVQQFAGVESVLQLQSTVINGLTVMRLIEVPTINHVM